MFAKIKECLIKNSLVQFVIIFAGTTYATFTYTMQGFICPFCGAPLYSHIGFSLAVALGAGTASLVMGVKKISQKINNYIYKKNK